MRLARRYSAERVENACARALALNGLSYKSVESILKNGLDQQPAVLDQTEDPTPLAHDNIRGNEYYH